MVDCDRKTICRIKEPALPVPEVSSQLWKIQNVLIFFYSPVIVGCLGLRRHLKYGCITNSS
jgi:hypothetical protein